MDKFQTFDPVVFGLGQAPSFMGAVGLEPGCPRGVRSQKKHPHAPHLEVFIPVAVSPLLIARVISTDYFLDGMIRRVGFWFFPMITLSTGLLAEWTGFLLNRKIKILLGSLIFLALVVVPFRNLKRAMAWRVPERYLDFHRGKVYVGGALSDVLVMKKGSRFIMENTTPSESMLAIPYDPLYCFLSDRRHAVPELIFMEHNLISAKREEEIIQDLKAKKVPLVLISNRYRSVEPGMGEFGKTHCRKLAAYLAENYREIQTFGPWDAYDQGFHAVKIYKRLP